jgi:hypothetical protein
MSNVVELAERIDRLRKGPPVDPPGGGGDNGGMDLSERVGRLEVDMKDVRDRLARMEPRMEAFATKGDLAETKSEIIKWVVGTAVGLGVAAITVMTFVLNNAIPKSPAAAAPQPIIIMPGAVSPPPAQQPSK